MKLQLQKSGLLAILFWALSGVLAFKIPCGSRYIWVPDTLLLLGFCPILIARRARWLWLGFGICNIIIGFTLAMAPVISDADFDLYHMVAIKKHLELYHPFMVWILIGFISTAVGIILLFVALIRSLARKIKRRES